MREHGYTPLVWPVIEICELHPPALVRNQQRVADADTVAQILHTPPQMVIAVSAHAVRIAVQQDLLGVAQQAAFVAVGAQTASQLGDVAANVVIPETATSEGVLALPVMADLSADDVVWVLAGEGGRELITQHLHREYAATVVKLELYQRQQRSTCPQQDARQIGAVVIGSQQGLHAFAHLWRKMSGKPSIPLILPSARVAMAARQAGFTELHTAAGADIQAVVGALQDIEKYD